MKEGESEKALDLEEVEEGFIVVFRDFLFYSNYAS